LNRLATDEAQAGETRQVKVDKWLTETVMSRSRKSGMKRGMKAWGDQAGKKARHGRGGALLYSWLLGGTSS
jgi:hypothetical protein